ncbi:MAG: ParB/RepB/Spo0J family partition protein [Planctomycetia bacterium]|nr:ParB/RepB/Spo0J family partition protein [Planctomycetia bacterium]
MSTEAVAGGPGHSAAPSSPARTNASPSFERDSATFERSAAPVDGLLSLSIHDVEANPFQPRREFDEAEIESLAASIRSHGLIQPITVRRVGGRYQLIAGERRLRAAGRAGWTEVPARLIEADDRLAAELAIVENLQRKDLNPLEKAISFRQYIERYGCTQEELAGRLEINRSTVANFIRLLELPEEVQQAVRSERITYGHARALLPLGDEREQADFCRRIQTEGLSVRAVEDFVQDAIHAADADPSDQPLDDADGAADAAPKVVRVRATKSKQTAALEQQLRLALGCKVDVRQSGKGRGKIVVHFPNHAEFERLFQQLAGPFHQAQAG